METAAAKTELKKLVKMFRAAEHMTEILTLAEGAEGHRDALAKECNELTAEKAGLQKTLKTMQEKFKKEAHELKAKETLFANEHRNQLSKYQDLETEARESVEAARAAYKKELKTLAAGFKAKVEEKELLLADLDKRVADAKNLLKDTMEKFKAIA